MIVNPYKRRPKPPRVAVLLPDERDGFAIVDEEGRRRDPELLPDELRVWGSYDVVHELVASGHGEALCWNNEEIRWRHRPLDAAGWTPRPSDVSVLKLPLPVDERQVLEALAAWRDWLAEYGASPTGTTGSAAWSLLRATLERTLWTTVGHPPPLRWTLGGRQELGPRGRGSFRGPLEHFDLPAAYASELGGLPYGGFWQHERDLPVRHEPAWWAQDGRPVFVRALVQLTGAAIGPLPRRPRRKLTGLGAVLLGAEYPTHGRIQGTWAWPELEAAVECGGARILRQLDMWAHLATWHPFGPWWRALEHGRSLPGLAGLLAKTTGNALWGRFCMDSRGGVRSIRGKHRGAMRQRPAPSRGGIPAAHDLAETISGRVRGKLLAGMTAAGSSLVSAHTDGLWTLAGTEPLDGWRIKERARRLDLLDPQVLRYWPSPSADDEPWHVFAGVPSELAADHFAELWTAAGFDNRSEAA